MNYYEIRGTIVDFKSSAAKSGRLYHVCHVKIDSPPSEVYLVLGEWVLGSVDVSVGMAIHAEGYVNLTRDMENKRRRFLRLEIKYLALDGVQIYGIPTRTKPPTEDDGSETETEGTQLG